MPSPKLCLLWVAAQAANRSIGRSQLHAITLFPSRPDPDAVARETCVPGTSATREVETGRSWYATSLAHRILPQPIRPERTNGFRTHRGSCGDLTKQTPDPSGGQRGRERFQQDRMATGLHRGRCGVGSRGGHENRRCWSCAAAQRRTIESRHVPVDGEYLRSRLFDKPERIHRAVRG